MLLNSARVTVLAATCAALSACAGSTAIRTSANTAIIQTSAAPVCGGFGAAKVAQQQAAIETLKAGYDRYIIVDTASANNVRATQLPGQYHTTGMVSGGFYSGTTTYTPGPTMVYGTHDQAFAIRMFRDGEAGSQQAVSARQALGDKWQEKVKAGAIRTCT